MKKLLLFLSIIVLSKFGNSQQIFLTDSSIGIISMSPNNNMWAETYVVPNIKSRYDTIIHFKGIDTLHKHRFVDERQMVKFMTYVIGCPDAGCPEDWLHIKTICTICLKHLEIQETRWVDKRDEYKEALEKLNKLLK